MRLWPGCDCCEETSTSETTSTSRTASTSSNPCGCDVLPTSWNVTISGMANAACDKCNANYNGSFSLAYLGNCSWSYGFYDPYVCNPFSGLDLLELTISYIAGGFRITVRWCIYDMATIGLRRYTTWQQDFSGSDCLLPSEFLSLLSDDNVVCNGGSATCHISAIA